MGRVLVIAATLALACCVAMLTVIVRQQQRRIDALTASASAARSKQQEVATQARCAASAASFVARRWWKPDAGSVFENHFNTRLNRCFVVVSNYDMGSDSRFVEIFDAIEGNRYGEYHGHDNCYPSIAGDPSKCRVDGGSIWFDGDDSRMPPDFAVGFRGMLYGGGAGDENTQKAFLDRARKLITE